MHFTDETPLDEVLKHITKATTTPSYAGIPIYVDPIDLQEAERSLDSTVQIDLEGVPLRTTLRLGLRQLGLDYSVRDGYLRIGFDEEDDLPGATVDPFQIVGHCLLALIAAGLGGVSALVVSDAYRERSAPGGIQGTSA